MIWSTSNILFFHKKINVSWCYAFYLNIFIIGQQTVADLQVKPGWWECPTAAGACNVNGWTRSWPWCKRYRYVRSICRWPRSGTRWDCVFVCTLHPESMGTGILHRHWSVMWVHMCPIRHWSVMTHVVSCVQHRNTTLFLRYPTF